MYYHFWGKPKFLGSPGLASFCHIMKRNVPINFLRKLLEIDAWKYDPPNIIHGLASFKKNQLPSSISYRVMIFDPFSGASMKTRPVQPPQGAEKFGLASKVKVHGLRNSHAKFQRFFIIWTIVVIFDIFLCRY